MILVLMAAITTTMAQNDDIEVADSTSTDWTGGGGGGITPEKPDDSVTELTLSQTTLTLEGGQQVLLVATVNRQAANKRILWTSANNDVATVDAKGLVTAVTKGITTITATAEGNTSLQQHCTVMVTSDYVPPAEEYVLPWGKESPWTMKYIFQQQDSYVEPADDAAGRHWTQLEYDDSQWPELTGPMGDSFIWYSTFNYIWEGEYNCFCLRRQFELPALDGSMLFTFMTQHDDDLWVYVNGELVVQDPNWTDERIVTFTIPNNVFRKGTNQLAIFIKQNWGGAFLDYALYRSTQYEDGVRGITEMGHSDLRNACDLGGRRLPAKTSTGRRLYVTRGKKYVQ